MRKPGSLWHLWVVAALLACLWLPGAPVEASWDWSVIIYGWASDVGMDVRSGDQAGGVDIDFGDLLDKVDFVLQGHLEGRRGRGGLFFDLTYIELGESQNIRGIGVFPDIELTILEAGGIFNPSGSGDGFDLLYGARVIDFDQEIEIVPPGPLGLRLLAVDTSSTLVDGFLGGRYTARIGDKGSFIVRADIGAGDTDQTLNAVAGFGYSFGRSGKYSLLLGYRHMEIELEEGGVETEMEMSGPMFGLKIGF